METTQAELAQPDQSVEEGTPIESAQLTPEIAGTLQSPPKLMTESEFRAMRRMHFTVRHGRVDMCGHRFDSITEPRTNCEYCWWAFFKSHGELVQVTDRAYQEQGSDFVDKLRGVKYRKNFLKFMATLAKFQAEAAAEKEKNGGSEEHGEDTGSQSLPENQSGENESSGIGGQEAGQAVQPAGDVPENGLESGPASTVNPE